MTKDERKAYLRQWREKNKERDQARRKQYRERHKEERRQKAKEYYQLHKEKCRQRSLAHYYRHREAIRARQNAHHRVRKGRLLSLPSSLLPALEAIQAYLGAQNHLETLAYLIRTAYGQLDGSK